MTRLQWAFGLASGVLLVACGGAADGGDGSSEAALAVQAFGPDSVAAAREGRSFIVELAPGGGAALDAWTSAHRAPARHFRHLSARAVDVASASDADEIRALDGVLGVYPNRVMSAIGKPGGGGTTTPAQVLPAGIARVKADQAWGSTTGSGVGLAVVDTGVDAAHSDLAHRSDCFTAFSDCADGHGHGTHVAGIVAALDNTVGVVGAAPGAVTYAVRVLDSSGSGTDETIISGLEWVLAQAALVDPPIRVANLSLGRPGSADDNPVLHQAVQNLVASGVTVVVAAGNEQSTEITQQVPAAYPEVLAIASTTAKAGTGLTKGACAGVTIAADTASYFTTDGPGVAVSAPGEESEKVANGCMIQSIGILSLARGGGTTRMSGTSMASPTAAGVVTLILSAEPALLPEDVGTRLAASASCVGIAPKNSPTGSYTFDGVREGVVDAVAALAGSGSVCP